MQTLWTLRTLQVRAKGKSDQPCDSPKLTDYHIRLRFPPIVGARRGLDVHLWFLERPPQLPIPTPAVTLTTTSFRLCPDSQTSISGVPPKTPSASSFVQSVASEDSAEEQYPVAHMLFDFSPTSEFELAVPGEIYCCNYKQCI